MSSGLKDLSLKVMEQVIKDGETTYSMVASQLIKILKENKALDYLEDGDDDEDLGKDSDHSRSIEDKNPSALDKKEKNIRRRVYDALNVQ